MQRKAQAGLEYILSYGWALILIVTAIGAFIFLTEEYVEKSSCSTSDQEHFFCKGAFISFQGNESSQSYMKWGNGRALMQISQDWPIEITGISYGISKKGGLVVAQQPGRQREMFECGSGEGAYYLEISLSKVNGRETESISQASPLHAESGSEIALEGLEFLFWHNGGCSFSFERLEEIKANPLVVTVEYIDRLGLENQVSLFLENFPMEEKWLP